MRGVFLDISKLFDVWYKKLLFKLKQKGISSKILIFFTDVLSNRNQIVALNGQNYSLKYVTVRIPEDSILCLLLFRIYINDLPDSLTSNSKLIAAVTFPFSLVKDIYSLAINFNSESAKISDWTF